MPTPWPRAVLFDFDGVIVNSEPLHFFAFSEILKPEHVDLTEEEYYNELIGFDDRGAFRHLFAKRNRPLEPKMLLALMTRKSQVMMDFIRRRQFHALPGVEEFVRTLWRRMPLAICSGGLREEIEAMLEAIALRDCFSVIVAAEDVEVGKPDPSGYLLATRQLSEKLKLPRPLKQQDCLVIEDAPTVIRSVKSVGFPTLAVATSYPEAKLSEANWVTKSLRSEEVARKLPELRLTEDVTS
jgi:beta-phosphoglucomutase